MTLLLLIIIGIVAYYFCIYKQNYKTILNGITNKKCPNCSNAVKSDFNVCPVCKETLRNKCINCEKMVDISWKYCPYCKDSLRERNLQ